jgi:flagellar basal body-associated protein FliL
MNNAQEHSNEMGKYLLIAVALLLVIVLGGVGVLMFWDVPAPSTPVEHAIPDAKLAK